MKKIIFMMMCVSSLSFAKDPWVHFNTTGDVGSKEYLLQRIELLERAVMQLQERVNYLEGGSPSGVGGVGVLRRKIFSCLLQTPSGKIFKSNHLTEMGAKSEILEECTKTLNNISECKDEKIKCSAE